MSSPRIPTRRAALACYGLATLLAFPHELPWGGSIDLGPLFAAVVPAALVLGIEGLPWRRAGRDAFLASLLAHLLFFHWFFVVTVEYGGASPWLGLLSPFAPALYVSLFTALFAMGWARLRASGRAGILVGAALWVTVDWARAHFLGGFPWATLGYALHFDVALLPLTRFMGVYGLSFGAAALGIALAGVGLAAEGRSSAGRRLAWTVAGVALAHALGGWLAPEESGDAPVVRIAAIQGNIDQGQKWDEERRFRILQKYMRLSESALDDGAEWIVWPETAVPGLIEIDPPLASKLSGFAREHRAPLFVGAMGVEPDASGRRIGAFFDSAFVYDGEGRLLDRYDKTHLVPFGEFVPLRGLLGRVFKALATGLSSADVTAGPAPRVVGSGEAPAVAGSIGALRVAVPICYEILFPHLMRGFGADGAGVLLAITNDAWYGRTGAPHQFLAMTAIRAAENGRWLVRAANTGISAIIDDRGRVRQKSALFEDAWLVGEVPILTGRRPTFYARHGDVFAALCAVTALGVLAGVVWTERGRREGQAADPASDEERRA